MLAQEPLGRVRQVTLDCRCGFFPVDVIGGDLFTRRQFNYLAVPRHVRQRAYRVLREREVGQAIAVQDLYAFGEIADSEEAEKGRLFRCECHGGGCLGDFDIGAGCYRCQDDDGAVHVVVVEHNLQSLLEKLFAGITGQIAGVAGRGVRREKALQSRTRFSRKLGDLQAGTHKRIGGNDAGTSRVRDYGDARSFEQRLRFETGGVVEHLVDGIDTMDTALAEYGRICCIGPGKAPGVTACSQCSLG